MKETCAIYFRALGFELADTDILGICLYVCQPLIWSVSYWHWFCLLCLLFHSLDQKGLIFSSDRNTPTPIKLLSESFKFKISESCPYILKLVKSHAMHLWSPPFLFCKCSLVISNRNKHFEYVHLLVFPAVVSLRQRWVLLLENHLASVKQTTVQIQWQIWYWQNWVHWDL